MTPEDLKTLIDGDADALAFALAGNDTACAARVSALLPKVSVQTQKTYRTLASGVPCLGIGIDATDRLINSVAHFAVLRPTVDAMQVALKSADDSRGIPIDDPSTQAMLDLMAATQVENGLTADDVAAIKVLCMQPQVISDIELGRLLSSVRARKGRRQNWGTAE